MALITLFSGDSKPFIRGRGDNLFKACLGCCLGFEDPKHFENEYDTFLTDFLRKIGSPKSRPVYKSFNISSIFGENRLEFIKFLREFTNFVDSQGVRINIVFSILNSSRLEGDIKLYGTSGYPLKTISPMKFMQILDDYFAYISVWSVLKISGISGVQIVLDEIQGEITNSWNELTKGNGVNVFPNGDSCNCHISSADMIVRYVSEELNLKRMKLVPQNFIYDKFNNKAW